MDARLRSLRIVHIAMLISLGLYVWMGEWLNKTPKALSDLVILKAIAIAATINGAIVLFIRLRFLPAAEEKLGPDSADLAVVLRWSTMYIVSFALSESIGLFGFALRFLGATLMQSAGFMRAQSFSCCSRLRAGHNIARG